MSGIWCLNSAQQRGRQGIRHVDNLQSVPISDVSETANHFHAECGGGQIDSGNQNRGGRIRDVNDLEAA